MKIKRFNEFYNSSENNFYNLIPDDIKDINYLFKKNKKKIYVVGGAVRDFLLNKEPKDFDLCTDANPDEVIEIIRKGGYKTIGEVGNSFGVVIVQTPNIKEGIEIATFRNDIGEGRRPDKVEFTTIENDVKRRDLTINALFYDMDKKEIVDLVGGLDDIKNKVIKTVGVANDRFREDPLRKLRAIRFCGRNMYKMDEDTKKAILYDNSLNGVSSERVRDEFKKSIETSKSTIYYLNMVEDFKMWEVMFPNLIINKNYIENNDWIIQISQLFFNNDFKIIKKEMNNYSFNKNEINNVLFFKKLKNINPSIVLNLYREYKSFNIDINRLIKFSEINKINKSIIDAFIRYKPSTDGNWVINNFNIKKSDISKKINEIEAEKFLKLLNS